MARPPSPLPAEEGQGFQLCNVCKQRLQEQLLPTIQHVYWYMDLHKLYLSVWFESHTQLL